jgi:predicted PhzF superfamily epimerase YddE/YHI9
VNGASHTVLAPYWARLSAAGEKVRVPLRARQASPRGGDLALVADFAAQRVTLAGPAAVTITGTMRVPARSTS